MFLGLEKKFTKKLMTLNLKFLVKENNEWSGRTMRKGQGGGQGDQLLGQRGHPGLLSVY